MNLGLACPKSLYKPRDIPDATFKYQKILGEGEFFAGGILNLDKGGGEKAPKSSKDNAYVSASAVYFALFLVIISLAIGLLCYRRSC